MYSTRQKVTGKEPLVRAIVKTAFPAYRGRKIWIEADTELNVKSYWDGGSRDYFTFVRLADMAVLPMPAQSGFDRQIPGAERAPIPPGFVCVEHSIFCGKDGGITLHVNPENLTKMLAGGTNA